MAKPKQERIYEVAINRVVLGQRIIRVKAKDEKAARKAAREAADGFMFADKEVKFIVRVNALSLDQDSPERRNDMNKQRQELAEKLLDELDANDLEEATRLFPKCRVAGEDLDNATTHIVDQLMLKTVEMGDDALRGLQEPDLRDELDELVRERIKKTPIKK
ncbi:hypothetical protein [uncultured Thiodictyon sp.]|uniref:hypothetical protein n=1 Tax=uncultured Thiodictyon sp. TaxID=1846217 RepID=UPI0025FAD378|nr:hypothetical protein [uncultured Thiodictyon sp.]